jgi:hypothetical protein
MKPIWKILIAAAVVISAVAAVMVIPHYRAKAAVAAYRAQLKAQGEKLSIAEMAPVVSVDDLSAGRQLLAAANFAVSFTNLPPAMRWISPGHALVSWAEAESPAEKTSNCWLELSALIKERPEVSDRIASAVRKPGIGFDVKYQNGFSTPLPHIAPVRKAGQWTSAATLLALHEKDTNSAWINLESEMELVTKYNSEPFIVCQLTRAAEMHAALATTWEALQYPGWSEPQLAQLQTNWESFALLDQLAPTFSMERATQELEMRKMRGSFNLYMDHEDAVNSGGFFNFDKMATNSRERAPSIYVRPFRYWAWKWWGSYDEELYALQVLQAQLAAVQALQKGGAFVPALHDFHETVINLQKLHPGWERRFVFAGMMDQVYLGFFLKIGEAEMARRMAVTAVALERYRLRHGEYPASLEQLTPNYLARMPIDFMDGKPLRYRRQNDGTFLLYSVGIDGADDGGDASPLASDTSERKLWYKMRDAVWPVPATPSEVKKYEAHALQKLSIKPVKPIPQPVPEPAGTNTNTN